MTDLQLYLAIGVPSVLALINLSVWCVVCTFQKEKTQMLKSPLGAASLLAALLGGPILAQSPTGQAPLASMMQSTKDPPPGWVDGSKNPELVPDHAAYRLILIHLSSLSPKRQDDRIQRYIGLASGADSNALKSELSSFAQQYQQWEAKATSPPSVDDDAAAKTLVLASRDAIKKVLTPDGVTKLTLYVENEKRRMVVKP